MSILKRLLAGFLGVVLAASTAFAGTVTIEGNIIDNYGNPAINIPVVEYPLKWTNTSAGTLMPNPVSVSTNSSGDWSMTVVGGVLAAIFIPPSGNIPYGLIQSTLPTSGTVTYASLAAQQPNIITGFPPNTNLNMGGFGFTNMAGATAVGGAMAYGAGLGSPLIFTATGSYPIPTNATLVEILLVAAGGGGAAAGGGAGQLLRCLSLASQGVGTVTIGAFGNGAATSGTGTNASDTTFVQTGGATCDAGGGQGASTTTGGAGGSASTPVSGGMVEQYIQNGIAGTNGSAGAGGNSGGPGGGGNGVSSGTGANGNQGYAVIWSY